MRLLALILLALLAPAALAQPAALSEEALARADSLVAAAVADGLVPGAVLSVSITGGAHLRTAHGYADVMAFDGSRLVEPERMRDTYLFDVASLTKVLATTTILLKLVDGGRVDLDEPVRRYLPGFSGRSKDSVTVRHLLTHTGGLAPWEPVYYHASTRRAAQTYVEAFPLAAPVGQARRYSDLGFMLLGYLVESVTELPLEDAYDQLVLGERLGDSRGRGAPGSAPTRGGFQPKPVGLDRSRLRLPRFVATSHGNPFERRMVADDTFGYVCDEDPEGFRRWRARTLVGEVNDGNAYYAHGGVAGHAGLFASAGEVEAILAMWLSEGRAEGADDFARPETVRAFLEADTVSGNALGWGRTSGVIAVADPPPGAFGHTGFTGTWAVGFPADGERPAFSVVLLTNRQHGGVDERGRYPDLGPLRRAVAAALLGR